VRKPEPEAEPAPAGPTEVELLAEIRDLLKKK
jgi:large-conductance mechanosensitive channel